MPAVLAAGRGQARRVQTLPRERVSVQTLPEHQLREARRVSVQRVRAQSPRARRGVPPLRRAGFVLAECPERLLGTRRRGPRGRRRAPDAPPRGGERGGGVRRRAPRRGGGGVPRGAEGGDDVRRKMGERRRRGGGRGRRRREVSGRAARGGAAVRGAVRGGAREPRGGGARRREIRAALEAFAAERFEAESLREARSERLGAFASLEGREGPSENPFARPHEWARWNAAASEPAPPSFGRAVAFLSRAVPVAAAVVEAEARRGGREGALDALGGGKGFGFDDGFSFGGPFARSPRRRRCSRFAAVAARRARRRRCPRGRSRRWRRRRVASRRGVSSAPSPRRRRRASSSPSRSRRRSERRRRWNAPRRRGRPTRSRRRWPRAKPSPTSPGSGSTTRRIPSPTGFFARGRTGLARSSSRTTRRGNGNERASGARLRSSPTPPPTWTRS